MPARRAGDKRFSSHVLEFMNFVDLVAILPFWAELVLHTHSELGVIRVLRLVRIFRVAKVSSRHVAMSERPCLVVSALLEHTPDSLSSLSRSTRAEMTFPVSRDCLSAARLSNP